MLCYVIQSSYTPLDSPMKIAYVRMTRCEIKLILPHVNEQKKKRIQMELKLHKKKVNDTSRQYLHFIDDLYRF